MKKLIFALIAGVTAMGAAQAQTVAKSPRAYVGVGVATADQDLNVPGATSASTESYKSSGKLFGGYEMDENFGVEAGYTDFRSATATFNSGGVPVRGETDGHAVYVAGKATAPINEQFSVFGKLGAAYNKAEMDSATPGMSRSDSETGVYAGLGAQYNINQQVALTVEYERYGKKKDFGPKPDVWTVAARYNF